MHFPPASSTSYMLIINLFKVIVVLTVVSDVSRLFTTDNINDAIPQSTSSQSNVEEQINASSECG